MRLFLKIFVGVLLFVECFLFLGGFMLLDFRSSPYLAGAVVALFLSFFVYSIWRLSDQVEDLQKRVKELEEQRQNHT